MPGGHDISVGEAQQGHQKQKVSQGEGCDLAVVSGFLEASGMGSLQG